MRRGRAYTGATAVVAAALFWIPAGTAGTATWQAGYSNDTTVQGYGPPQQQVLPTPPKGGTAPNGTAPSTRTVVLSGGVQGAHKTIRQAPLAAVKSGALPFTGAQLGLFAIVGLALLAMGLLLRSTGRQRTQS
jgi:hypothetical protein